MEEELSRGDEERIEEVKSWLRSGMTIADAREELGSMGYTNYHISFLLEEATGQKFVPPKPQVLIDTTKIRIVMFLVTLMALGTVVWWYFLR